jgi:hypothetical protein
MSELTLVGLDEDGEHVVLEGADGQRFRVRIDEALRAAVRRDRPQMEKARAEASGLPPREIQARVRAGQTAEEIAEATGTPVEVVRRYDGPVLAERQYVAEQAQATRVGHDPSSPVLGELVTDRLATRAVRSSTWDAYREGTGPWTVEVRFEVAGSERSARWSFDPAARRVRALDDEARWLSETELPDAPIRRHLAPVRDQVFDVEVDAALRPLLAEIDPPVEPEDAEPVADETHALLDDLAGRRGVRQPAEPAADEDEEFSGFGPQHAFDFDHPELTVPAAHPPASRPEEAQDARVLRMPRADRADDAPEADAGDEASGEERRTEPAEGSRGRGRRGRASVPSWDEIVFGARHE